jgi:hypothetical protein
MVSRIRYIWSFLVTVLTIMSFKPRTFCRTVSGSDANWGYPASFPLSWEAYIAPPYHLVRPIYMEAGEKSAPMEIPRVPPTVLKRPYVAVEVA